MKSRVIMIILAFIMVASVFDYPIVAQTTLPYDVDFTYSYSGVVKVLNNPGVTTKMKLIIEKGENKYIYNISNNANYVSFPLQLGSGKYVVKLYENTTGTKYKTVYSESSDVTIYNSNSAYLASTQQVNWNENNDAIALAKKLLNDALWVKIVTTRNNHAKLTEKEKIDILYNYVVKNMDYDYNKIETLSYDYVPDIDVVLKAKKGICFDYSVLLAAMLRSQGIPTKLIKGESTNTDVYHAWNEIYLSSENRWIIVDTTYDAYMHDNKKSYSMEKPVNQYTKQLEF